MTPTLEQDLQRASDHLSGQKRDLAFSVVHLVEIAQGLVEISLTTVEAR